MIDARKALAEALGRRRMLSAGRLRQRVDIMRATKADTGKGGTTTSWGPIASAVPAEVLGLTGAGLKPA